MNLKKSNPLFFALGAGLLGFCLRSALYRTGFDNRNILSSSHPLHLACLILAAATALCLALAVRKRDGSSDPQHNFPNHPLRIPLCLVSAVLTVYYSVSLLRRIDDAQFFIQGILGAGAGVFMVLHPWLSQKAPAVDTCGHGLLGAFFALDMLGRYPSWSGNPQLPDYVFQVFACVLLILTCYQRMAFSADSGKRRPMLFCSLMSIFLCLVCLAGPDTLVFYLGGLFWSGACMCVPTPPVPIPESTQDSE